MEKIKKLIKHDRYIEELCTKLEDKYDYIEKNVKLYSKKKRIIGEIDILAYKDNYCDIYEVKCSHRISKAKRQLRKLKRIVSTESKIRNTFFFCGASGMIEMIL